MGTVVRGSGIGGVYNMELKKGELDAISKMNLEPEIEVPQYVEPEKKQKFPKEKQKTFMKRFSIRRIKDMFAPHRTVLVEMNFSNGTVSHYTTKTIRGYIKVKGGVYVVDESVMKYNNTSKLYMLRYHEGFAMPLSWELDAHDLKTRIPDEMFESAGQYHVITSFNPYVLIDVIKGEYTKGVLAGAEVSVILKRSFFLIIIVGAISMIHFIVHIYKAGWI